MGGRALASSRPRGMLSVALLGLLALPTTAPLTAAPEPPDGTRISEVEVEDRGGAATVVVVTFDGPIAGHRRFQMNGGEPRALVRIAGIVDAYRPYEVPVNDGRVVRVRIGHHPEFDPPEEHLVFDLEDADVAITRVVDQGRTLTVVLERGGAPGEAPPAAPSRPLPEPVRPTPTTALPTPTASPTATAPPPPFATATPRPPAPSPSAAPLPPAPTPSPDPREALPTATQGDRVGPSATPAPRRQPGFAGPLLTELVVAHLEDGSALVRVSADSPIDRNEVRYLGVRGAPPRNILRLVGVGLPGEDAVLPVRDGLLCEVQVVFRAGAEPARTEVILFLASEGVRAERAAAKGAHAAVQLMPPEDPGAPLGCGVEAGSGTLGWRFTPAGPAEKVVDARTSPTPRGRRR